MSSRSSTDTVEFAVGRIRSPFGLAGEVKVESYSGETDHLTALSEVTVGTVDGGVRRVVESFRVSGSVLLLKLEGIDSPEAAKSLSGLEILAPRSMAAPCGPDEYYYADLVGLRVRCAGADSGVVETIWEQGPAVFLGVRTVDGREHLVPFQRYFVGDVDLPGGTIEVLSAEVLE